MMQTNVGLIQGPQTDIGGSYFQGATDGQKLADFARADQARPLIGDALTGNADALKQLAGVDPASYITTQAAVQKQTDDKTKAASDHLGEISGLLNWADTPDKWSQAMTHLDQQGVPVDPNERDFGNRNMLLAQTQTYSDQLKAQQAAASAAASKVPQGYAMAPDGESMPFIPKGPADPAQVAALASAKKPAAESIFANAPQVTLDENNAPDKQSQQDFLASIPDAGKRTMIQGMADYTLNPKNISIKDNQRASLIEAAKQYDPTYDDTQFAARSAARKDMAPGGKTALAMKSANNAIGHANTLLDQVDGLQNTNSGIANSAFSALGSTFSATDRTAKMNAAQSTADALANELGKFFHGTGSVAEGEVNNWRRTLDLNAAPDVIKSGINNVITKLLPTGFESARSQYQSTFGKPSDARFLSPQSAQILTKRGIDPNTVEPNAPGGGGGGGGGNIIQMKDLPAAYAAAQNAIKLGAEPKAVIQRLIKRGVDPSYAGTLNNGQ